MKVRIADVYIAERQRKDMGDVTDLAESLKANGQISPICVRPVDDQDRAEPRYNGQPWALVAGGRRMAAAMIAGWQELEAMPRESLSPYMQQVIELEENIKRKELTWDEDVAARARIHELYMKEQEARIARGEASTPQSIRDTAREIGTSHSAMVRDLQLHQMLQKHPELKAAGSRKGALRQLEIKKQTEKRIASVTHVNIPDLRQRLVTADMRDFVRTIKSGSVPLFFCDFPFGIDYWSSRGESHTDKYEDDPGVIRDLLADVVPQMARAVSRRGWIVCMMGPGNATYLQRLFVGACRIHADYAPVEWSDSAGWFLRTEHQCEAGKSSPVPCMFLNQEEIPWIWYRPNSRNPTMHPDIHAKNMYESIIVVNGGEAKFLKQQENVIAINADYTDRIHEMQRPHALCKQIVETFSLPGEEVIDLCFGSGSALAAAAELGRSPRGCDLNPNNLDKAIAHVAMHWKPAKPKTPTEQRTELETDPEFNAALAGVFEELNPEVSE